MGQANEFLLPRFTPEAWQAKQVQLICLQGGSREEGDTAQIALAWLLAWKPRTVPIPGTRKLARPDENLGALAVELASADLRAIDGAAGNIEVQGARYPEETGLNRSTTNNTGANNEIGDKNGYRQK